ncbi:hypothetical protein UFOVP56_52 [uncultured Caudovirales phage]|uniref:Uncharacterized protein n=1 Tax=uncultured Caudovirales phage TaxID=2100421 RepID=A0A6J5TB04_9CAUD|nr:hypothetical protein UFOVP56_52 [uncultured Caudovirales phage]
MKRQVKMGAISYAAMAKMMIEGDYSCMEIAEETGLHYVTVLQYTRELHRAGAAYVHHWDKDRMGRDTVRIYKLGVGKDKPRSRMSSAERCARHRVKAASITMIQRMAA